MRKLWRVGLGKAFVMTPARAMVLSFLFLIVVGTLVLSRPALITDHNNSMIDTIFLATSAVCVTGLSPLDIGSHFSRTGQVMLAVLIELGGLGIMLSTSSLLLLFGGRLGLRSRRRMQEQFQGLGMSGIMRLSRYTLGFVLLVELVGAAFLFVGWLPTCSMGDAAFRAFFHSVSAFCCAGFSTISDNLISYRSNILINYTIMAEIIVGGLGFLVIMEILGHRVSDPDEPLVDGVLRSRLLHMSVHTRVVLLSTIALVLGGALAFGFMERDNPQVNDGFNIITISLMQSVTCRTAGFCSVDIARLHEDTRQMMMLLMFVGGAPGGTAGGVKVTTFALLIMATWAQIRGRREVIVAGRKIPYRRILQASALTVVAILAVVVATTVINLFESLPYDLLLFEVVSALGTVGLSADVTPKLGDVAKILICVAMFVGRVGPLTFAASLISTSRNTPLTDHAEAEIVIG